MIFPKGHAIINWSLLPTAMQDWMPTLYRAAGGSPSDLGGIDGMDMWNALLRNRCTPISWHWGNGQWTYEKPTVSVWTICNHFQGLSQEPNASQYWRTAWNSSGEQTKIDKYEKSKLQSSPRYVCQEVINRVNTGEGWGLEVGEGHNLRGSLGQLVLSSVIWILLGVRR